MRRVILNVAVSLDSFIEGPNGEYDWCFADQDYGMTEFFSQIEIIFMGRKSYDLIKRTGDINAFPQYKFVFSDTLVPEENPAVEIIRKADFLSEVQKIRTSPGGDIWLFGGAELVSAFVQAGLVDELLLSIHPILLGSGKPLFEHIGRTNLQFMGSKSYSSGLLQARYGLV